MGTDIGIGGLYGAQWIPMGRWGGRSAAVACREESLYIYLSLIGETSSGCEPTTGTVSPLRVWAWNLPTRWC
jgi:hypothetical protein